MLMPIRFIDAIFVWCLFTLPVSPFISDTIATILLRWRYVAISLTLPLLLTPLRCQTLISCFCLCIIASPPAFHAASCCHTLCLLYCRYADYWWRCCWCCRRCLLMLDGAMLLMLWCQRSLFSIADYAISMLCLPHITLIAIISPSMPSFRYAGRLGRWFSRHFAIDFIADADISVYAIAYWIFRCLVEPSLICHAFDRYWSSIFHIIFWHIIAWCIFAMTCFISMPRLRHYWAAWFSSLLVTHCKRPHHH